MDFPGFFAVFVPVAAVFAIGAAAMSIGVVLKRPCLRGSCGGPDAVGPDGLPLGCTACPNRKRPIDRFAEH